MLKTGLGAVQIGTTGAVEITNIVATSCPDLKELLLNGNQISEAGVRKIQVRDMSQCKVDFVSLGIVSCHPIARRIS